MNRGSSSQSQSAPGATGPSLGIRAGRIHSAQARIEFESHPAPSSLNDDNLIRSVIASSIRQSWRSRDQIAEEMTASLGVRVTAKMLDTYSAASMKPNRLPAAWLRAFCAAAGDDALLEAVATAAGYRLVGDEEIKLLELGRQYLRRKRADQEAALIEEKLRGLEL